MPNAKPSKAMLIDENDRSAEGDYAMKATVVCGTVTRRERLTELSGYGAPFAVVEILENLEEPVNSRNTNFVETAYADPKDAIKHIENSNVADLVGLVRVANVEDELYNTAIQLFKTDSRFIVIKVPNEPGDVDSLIKYTVNNSETRAFIGELFSFGEIQKQNSIGLVGYNAKELTEYFNLFK
jgi:hypothetical protein